MLEVIPFIVLAIIVVLMFAPIIALMFRDALEDLGLGGEVRGMAVENEKPQNPKQTTI